MKPFGDTQKDLAFLQRLTNWTKAKSLRWHLIRVASPSNSGKKTALSYQAFLSSCVILLGKRQEIECSIKTESHEPLQIGARNPVALEELYQAVTSQFPDEEFYDSLIDGFLEEGYNPD